MFFSSKIAGTGRTFIFLFPVGLENKTQMNIFILDNEVVIRLGFFFGVLITMAIWEILAPRRTLTMPRVTRWFNNLLITFLNSAAVKIVFPITAMMLAPDFEKNGYGFLNIIRATPLFGGLLTDLFVQNINCILAKTFSTDSPPDARMQKVSELVAEVME